MTTRTNPGELITVIGGSGFLGRYVVRALAKLGYRVRAAVRRPDLAGHLQPMGAPGQIHAVQTNLRYPASIAKAVSGAAGVVNLAAILDESGGQTFEAVHARGAEEAARAAHEAGARCFVQVSALGADEASNSNYARTKAEGERGVRAAFPDAVILRPSIMFGPEDQFFNRFATLARISPVLPLIGGGRTKFQPLYVGDVADAVVAALEGRGRAGVTYELGGPETLDFKALMNRMLDYTERKRAFVPVPFWFAKFKALLISPLPNRPLTVDQVRLLERDNVVSAAAVEEGRTLGDLGIDNPMPIELIVPGYLERFHAKGQYAHYRG